MPKGGMIIPKKHWARKKMVQALKTYGPLHRRELAKASGYSPQYISTLIHHYKDYFEIEKVERLDRQGRARIMILISLKEAPGCRHMSK